MSIISMSRIKCRLNATLGIDQGQGAIWSAVGSDPQIHLSLAHPVATKISTICRISLTVQKPQLGQLFWSSNPDRFAESASQRCFLRQGINHLVLRIPAGNTVHYLRFDPAERPCEFSWHDACIEHSVFAWLLAPEPPHQTPTRVDLLGRGLRALWAAFPCRRQEIPLHPLHQAHLDQDDHLVLEGDDPHLEADDRFLRGPLTRAHLTVHTDQPRRMQFFWSGRSPYDEDRSRIIPVNVAGENFVSFPLPLPLRALRLRLDPGDAPGRIRHLKLQLINDPWFPMVFAWNSLRAIFGLLLHLALGYAHRLVRRFMPNQAIDAPLDVIIPVYNGFDVLAPCLESALAHSPTNCRIIVIDDASPDPRIGPLLESFQQRGDPRLISARNERNLGFVGTVNRGMGMGGGHVILLNSDTEVPPGWVERLVACWAHDAQGIGTVTAMSNNATICSFPGFCQDNNLWPGESAVAVDDAFRSLHNQPVHLPTGVGFCIFISRACISRVGLFDEATFGRGYGEENDFCLRAQRYGYASVAATNCFVYHKGSVSFAAESKPSLARNLALLNARWPFYGRNVDRFIRADPLAPVRIQVAITLLAKRRAPGRPLVVQIVSGAISGGTRKHVDELIDSLEPECECLLLIVESRHLHLRLGTSGSTVRLDATADHATVVMKALLFAFKPQCLHLHHLIHQNLKWRTAIQRSSIPYFFTAHDYHSACPSYTLLNHKLKYCGGEQLVAKCQSCLLRSPHATPMGVAVKTWRTGWRGFLSNARAVIVPSITAYDLIRSYYPETRCIVIPHGQRTLVRQRVDSPGPRQDRDVLTVACLGALGPSKGSDLIHKLADSIHLRGLPIRLVVLGYTDRAQNDCTLSGGALVVTGPYKANELPGLVSRYRPDLALLPSIWPETFSYTISECWQLSLPVIVGPLGAQRERVQAQRGGWVVDHLDVATVLSLLQELQQSPASIDVVRDRLATLREPTLRDMAKAHLNVYTGE